MPLKPRMGMLFSNRVNLSHVDGRSFKLKQDSWLMMFYFIASEEVVVATKAHAKFYSS